MDDQEKQTSAASTPRILRKAGTRGRVSRRLVIASSAAVLAVYTIGFARTQSAADQITAASNLATSGTSSSAGVSTRPTAAPVAPAPSANPPSRYAEAIDDDNGDSDAITSRDDASEGVSEHRLTSAPATAQPTASQPPAVATAVAPAASPNLLAPTPTQAPAASPTSVSTSYRDGTYTGSGMSRHGGIAVQVTVKGGKIVSAQITRSSTRYPVSQISSLPGEVIAAQGANVDMVSGATDSSTAYLTAVANALTQAA